MSAKADKRLSPHDYIDDIIEIPTSSSNFLSSKLKDGMKIYQNRNYLSTPSLFEKSKHEQIDNLLIPVANDIRDRTSLMSGHSNLSSNVLSNDDRRKEIDFIIKHLYDGKLLTINDDRIASDVSEQSMRMLSKGPITTTSTGKNDDERRSSLGNIDLLPLDGDIAILQRELQEKELDIIHLHKEIQELQLENKLLKAKVPTVYSNGYASNNSEVDAFRRERDILQNELRTLQELVAKLQNQQYQNVTTVRSNKIDEVTVQQNEALQKKLRSYEKQIRTLIDENDRLKQNIQQSERTIAQYKKEKEELQQKVNEAKKRNDELFYQEFNSLRNDLKIIKQKNNELFEENLRLQQEKRGRNWHSSTNEQQPMAPTGSVSPIKVPSLDLKNPKITRSESPNMSEASDSTNYLATVSIERYNHRPLSLVNRSITLDGNNNYSRTKRYNTTIEQDNFNRNDYSKPAFNLIDQSYDFRSLKLHRGVEWNDEPNKKTTDVIDYDDDRQSIDNKKHSLSSYSTHHHTEFKDLPHKLEDRRIARRQNENQTPRRPFAPSSISDIRVNDVVKFSRPGGKITKGIVKYVGSLPGKSDQYLGLELEDEESKHDGVYQDKRLFQCKPNKGIFIAFNKVIMAWSNT